MHIARAALVLFIASFCTLVIEIVAGRIMAPYVGVSLYTWTSIIGVVLAGISAGAWAGGIVADRRATAATVGLLLLISGVASLLIVPLTDIVAGDEGLLNRLELAQSLLARVVVLSLLLFFPPAFLLGMISPVAVKLAVDDLDSAGRVVGTLYAISTIGSIAGTFVTGFYLIANYGTRATLLGVSIVLIAAGVLLGSFFSPRIEAAGAAIVVPLLMWMLASPAQARQLYTQLSSRSLPIGTIFETESQYYTIRVEETVREDTGAPLRALHLDHLTHSYSDLADPAYLEYGYLRIFREIVRWRALNGGELRLLFVGGGGYTLPRWIERTYPEARIDVMEIDPAVTRTAKTYLGLSADTRVRTFHGDARWQAMRSSEQYDIIFVDVFNDLSVPYHLTTREFVANLNRLLHFDGVIVANVIDNYARGAFLPSYLNTLQSVFGENNVGLLLDAPGDADDVSSTYVPVASTRADHLIDFIYGGNAAGSFGYAMPRAELESYLSRGRGFVLTDDFVPVDNMLAARFAERFVE